jgi:hypothetical protein
MLFEEELILSSNKNAAMPIIIMKDLMQHSKP